MRMFGTAPTTEHARAFEAAVVQPSMMEKGEEYAGTNCDMTQRFSNCVRVCTSTSSSDAGAGGAGAQPRSEVAVGAAVSTSVSRHIVTARQARLEEGAAATVSHSSAPHTASVEHSRSTRVVGSRLVNCVASAAELPAK